MDSKNLFDRFSPVRGPALSAIHQPEAAQRLSQAAPQNGVGLNESLA
jgi:hypothetical protein